MAEAIAALGLASNILQFIDFGSKLVGRFYDLYRASRNAEVIPDVELLTKDLQAISQQLSVQNDGQSQSLARFQLLAQECSKLAAELLDMLKSLTKSKKSDSKMSAIKTAFKTMWKEDDISRLQHRLEQYRSQLVLHIVSESREQIRSSEVNQRQILERIEEKLDKANDKQTASQIDEALGSRIVDLIVSKLGTIDKVEWRRSLETDLIEALYTDDVKREDVKPSMSPSQRMELSKRILGRLAFPNMRARWETIADAHVETFKWIFDQRDEHDQKWSDFPTWLSSDSRIYWVTGKAGSGKSTLMKYIGQFQSYSYTREEPVETRCHQYLRCWAPEPLTLVVATYFFWNSGTELQMSQSGLLRTLLYQILSQLPGLIPLTMPGRWDALCLFGDDTHTDWTEVELKRMLMLAIENLDEDVRLCLFVDGLDECQGDLTLLVQLFKELLQHPNVKMCVSSRPWEIFERAFNQNPSLRMEILTYDDIKGYTSAVLISNLDFAALQEREPEHSSYLIENIVEKACGVFLWVKLVVSSLLAGMNHGDRVVDLRRRLDTLPSELEKLYDNMLNTLDPFYLEHAAQLFELTEVALKPLTILLFSFVDEEDYDSATKREVKPLTNLELNLRVESMMRRINSRTKGLLEVSRIQQKNVSSPNNVTSISHTSVVQYLHRTVRDYMKSPKVRSYLQNLLKDSFDVHARICVGLLAYTKTKQPLSTLMSEDSVFWADATQFMKSASLVRCENRVQTIKIMDAFNQTARHLARLVPCGHFGTIKKVHCKAGNWVALHPRFQHPRFGRHFQSLAVVCGVDYYIDARATPTCFVQRTKAMADSTARVKHRIHPLLEDAFFNENYQKGKERACPKIETIEFLVRRGARFLIDPDLSSGVEDPIVEITNDLIAHEQRFFLEHELRGWISVIRFLNENHDIIWLEDEVRNLEPSYKTAYHAKIRQLIQNTIPWETRLNIKEKEGSSSVWAFLGLSSSPEQDLHQDRHDLLRNLETRLCKLLANNRYLS